MLAHTEQNHQMDEREWTQDQHFTASLKMTRISKCLEDGIIWLHETLEELSGRGKKVTVVVDSAAAENVMPRSMVSEISTEETERSKNGKGFRDQEESTSRI